MPEKLRSALSYQFTIAELIGLGVILGTPYLVIGTIWSMTHTDHLPDLRGADLVVSFLGSIVSWPVLVFSNVCMT
jgi:apolipoprotein N-acyltransferase